MGTTNIINVPKVLTYIIEFLLCKKRRKEMGKAKKSKKKVEHYVEFIFPGILVSSSSYEEVSSRRKCEVKLPDGAIAFRFFDLEIMKGGKTKQTNFSPMTYVGTKFTVRKAMEYLENSISLMKRYEASPETIKEVVLTRYGKWYPLTGDDTVL